MTRMTWTVLGLFLLGNAFFVLPVHITSNNTTTSYTVNYKKDTPLFQTAFPDTTIRLELNMPGNYYAVYQELNKKKTGHDQHPHLNVNVYISHDLGFTPLAFPFYKSANFNAQVAYQGTIINSEQQGIDSVALIGNMIVLGKLRITGICTPLYAKKVVEKELARILQKEMTKLEQDINAHLRVTFPEVIVPVKDPPRVKRFRKKK
jgi:hypothetical protein